MLATHPSCPKWGKLSAMRDGTASTTAQRVAAHRLTFERVPAAYGDPAADELLARDVAGSVQGGASIMADYLAARTKFFDRVVVGALDRGLNQVVIAAAGYDGRAWRYAKPGVRWFEIDHPDTQRDKRERLERLRIETAHVAYVPSDFAVDPVASALVAAGLDAQRAALFLVEGVAVYLDRSVLERLLRELGDVAGPASRLAISLSVDTGRGLPARRAAFQSAVAAMGEPARTVLTADDADALFAATGWQVPAPGDERQARARHAGLVVVTRC
jgi:methyltransferase (TIGR00027 family)